MASIQEERLQAYLDAEKKALRSQEVTIGSRRIRRAELSQIGASINNLLSAGVGSTDFSPGSRSKRVILRDL
ncbi:hypothetical protein SCACP_21460 [Sporomusa carbonis]|uniref:DUF6148 family protein n=1 Tax=Sporomusa carbonis TaxID=3076075 RepID=UPI003A63E42B